LEKYIEREGIMMPRKFEPNINDVLKEKELLIKQVKFYKNLMLDLTDYIITNGDEEHLIESLLASNYTPLEIINDMEFDRETVEHIARLKGYNVFSDY
jgi:hypothetical protein